MHLVFLNCGSISITDFFPNSHLSSYATSRHMIGKISKSSGQVIFLLCWSGSSCSAWWAGAASLSRRRRSSLTTTKFMEQHYEETFLLYVYSPCQSLTTLNCCYIDSYKVLDEYLSVFQLLEFQIKIHQFSFCNYKFLFSI